MKLVSFTNSEGKERVGLRLGGPLPSQASIVDFGAATTYLRSQGKSPSAVEASAFECMIDFIRNQDQTLPAARATEELFKSGKLPDGLRMPETQVRLLAPIPQPVSMRDGYAFRQHVEAARKGRGLPMIPEFDEFPVFYYTNHLAVTGPGPVSVREKHLERLDFELEYAIVIGKEGRNLRASEADDTIFGYMIMNDWSARELQTQEMKMSLGPAKGKDFATSLGPYLVTRDELASRTERSANGDRQTLRMQAWVNNTQVSEGRTQDMTWTFAQIVERVSYGVTLRPGEVIGSGTVGTGCFMELNATGKTAGQWLKHGDHVVLEVEGLGRLENTIQLARV